MKRQVSALLALLVFLCGCVPLPQRREPDPPPGPPPDSLVCRFPAKRVWDADQDEWFCGVPVQQCYTFGSSTPRWSLYSSGCTVTWKRVE